MTMELCTNHTGKMRGMASVSTSPLDNPICRARHKIVGMICSHCYARAMVVQYQALADKLHRNAVLMAELIADDEIPIINAKKFPMFRIESFGDIANWIQAANYIRLIKKNPSVMFAWWTKNPWFISEAIYNGYKLPKNVSIIFSSSYLNKTGGGTKEELKAKYPFVNHRFTVYDKDAAEKVDINCGARSCKTCGRCYSKRTSFEVREKLK